MALAGTQTIALQATTTGDVETPFLSQQILEEPQVQALWLEMDSAVTAPPNRRCADHNALEFSNVPGQDHEMIPAPTAKPVRHVGSDTGLSSCATSESDMRALAQVEVHEER